MEAKCTTSPTFYESYLSLSQIPPHNRGCTHLPGRALRKVRDPDEVLHRIEKHFQRTASAGSEYFQALLFTKTETRRKKGFLHLAPTVGYRTLQSTGTLKTLQQTIGYECAKGVPRSVCHGTHRQRSSSGKQRCVRYDGQKLYVKRVKRMGKEEKKSIF